MNRFFETFSSQIFLLIYEISSPMNMPMNIWKFGPMTIAISILMIILSFAFADCDCDGHARKHSCKSFRIWFWGLNEPYCWIISLLSKCQNRPSQVRASYTDCTRLSDQVDFGNFRCFIQDASTRVIYKEGFILSSQLFGGWCMSTHQTRQGSIRNTIVQVTQVPESFGGVRPILSYKVGHNMLYSVRLLMERRKNTVTTFKGDLDAVRYPNRLWMWRQNNSWQIKR